jgi:hypothetical protein
MPRLITLKSSSFCSLWTCLYNTPILFSLLFVFLCVDKSVHYITHPWKKRNNIYPCFALSPQILEKNLGASK